MTTPDRPGWYADPLKPATQERRWDGTEWTDDTREASVPVADAEPPPGPAPELVEEVDEVEEAEPARDVAEASPPVTLDKAADQDAQDVPEARPARRTTVALVAAIVILLGVALLQAAYLWGPLADDATVSSQRPVLISKAAERSAADTAGKAAAAFTSRSFENYDEQVDDAAAMMTKGFAQEFRQTTDDAKDAFVEAQAVVTAEVAAQAVMTASEEQVEVLIVLNQFTTKPDTESTFTPFRLKVTLIDTDQGWLVSDVDAS